MKNKLLLIFVPFLLSSCSFLFPKKPTSESQSSGSVSITSETTSVSQGNTTSSANTSAGGNSSNSGSKTSQSTGTTSSSANTSSSGSKTSQSSGTSSSSEDSGTRVESISFPKKYLDLQINKYEYLAVNFYPSSEDLTDEEKEGAFASSDTSVATVSQYGKVTGIKVGSAVITYTTTIGELIAAMTVYVHESIDDIKREYLKVDDVDTIKEGDELIFACPDFGVAASIDEKSGYVLTSPVTFESSNTKIKSYGDQVAEYYVGPGKYGDSFTLEAQNNTYLAGRETEQTMKLSYSANGKAQINWIIERPEGFSEDFIVSDDIQEDCWLMFNKINSSDIRFNLYRSNDTTLVKKPTIYRKTIIR